MDDPKMREIVKHRFQENIQRIEIERKRRSELRSQRAPLLEGFLQELSKRLKRVVELMPRFRDEVLKKSNDLKFLDSDDLPESVPQ
jgi:response regulator RpfG family c-di-GMP phosphodiesterase